MPRDARGLTPKQAAFVREYLIDRNATQAAIRAGYAPGKTAEVQGHRLLSNAKVRAAVDAATQEHAEKAGITVEWVMNGLKSVAERCSGGDTFEAAGANRALELLGKHLGMFKEGSGSAPVVVEIRKLG